MSAAFFHKLVCPYDHAPLSSRDENTALECRSCGNRYPVAGGVPVMMNEQARRRYGQKVLSPEAHRMRQDYELHGGGARRGRFRPPEVMLFSGPDPRAPAYDYFYGPKGGDSLVLSIGGGPLRYRPQEIKLNIGLFPNVDIVADGEFLPFEAGAVDSVVCKAVLEHVSDPRRIIAEIMRVLKPGGYVWLEMPFIFAYHGYPADYWRASRDGLRSWASGFEEIESGITQGPTSALLQTALFYLLFLLNPGSGRARQKLISGIFRSLLFPWKYLDRFLIKRPGAHALAAGFYFIGRKQRS
jgi:uncharacterized protein YbaR (Trm112 family)/SAM-dependent methyltransferase